MALGHAIHSHHQMLSLQQKTAMEELRDKWQMWNLIRNRTAESFDRNCHSCTANRCQKMALSTLLTWVIETWCFPTSYNQ